VQLAILNEKRKEQGRKLEGRYCRKGQRVQFAIVNAAAGFLFWGREETKRGVREFFGDNTRQNRGTDMHDEGKKFFEASPKEKSMRR